MIDRSWPESASRNQETACTARRAVQGADRVPPRPAGRAGFGRETAAYRDDGQGAAVREMAEVAPEGRDVA